MNIKDLKTLIANLPDEVTAEQFAMIEQDYEDLLARQRQADADALADYEQKCAKLREKLGLNAPPPGPRPPANTTRSEIDETDAGNGIGETESSTSAEAFRDELASLRERTQEKRRRM